MTRALIYIDDLALKGGGERLAMYFLKALIQNEIEVYFLTLTEIDTFDEINLYYRNNQEKFFKGWIFSRFLYIIPKKSKIVSIALDYMFLIFTYIQLFSINRKVRPDIYLVIANTIYQNAPFILHGKQVFSWGLTPFTKKWILFFHNLILKLGLKRVKLTLIVGSRQQKQVSEPEYRPYINLISVGYDDTIFNYNGEKKIKRKIVYIARLSPEKRVDLAIEAAKLLKKKNVKFKLAIVGYIQDKRYYENLKMKIMKYVLSDCVEIIPEHSQFIIKKNMVEAEVFWNFSKGYGGVVNYEALACGCIPVVFSNFKDQIGENGYSVNNIDEVVKATIKIFKMSDNEREYFALKCSRYAKKYSRSLFEKRFINLLLSKLEDRG